jgi:hypothetical protein
VSKTAEADRHPCSDQRAADGAAEDRMQYILMLYSNEAGWPAMTPAQQQEAIAAYTAYTDALQKADVLRGVNRLQPTSKAATVRVTGGQTRVLDGPYADAKEQLGGYYVIDVPDLDAAISWAARCPAASHGVVEIRPLWA